jgi:small subunit ribosomal protein S6
VESSFRFNDAVIRSLTLLRDEAITEPSFLIRAGQNESEVEKNLDDDVEDEEEIVLVEDALVADIEPAVTNL